MNSLLETKDRRAQAREALERCLYDPVQLQNMPLEVLALIMESGAPQRFRQQQPEEFLVEGQAVVEISPRMKKIAIRKTLATLESMTLEQLELFAPEEVPGHEPEVEQTTLF